MGNRSSIRSDLDPNMFAHVIPGDVFIEIFSHLNAKDIIRCSMVCAKWRQLIVNHRFWLQQYCTHGPLNLQWAERLKMLPIQDVQRCLTLGAFGRNLIADDFTNLIPEIDDRWSDYHESRNSEYGLTAEILRTLDANIVVSEYFTNRADCACVYVLRASLITDDEDMDSENFTERVQDRIDQWEPEFWRKAELIFEDIPPNAIGIEVSSRGCDRQFWAGNYGAKIAGISLRIGLNTPKQEPMETMED